jgi:S1-C subfamily serine protease
VIIGAGVAVGVVGCLVILAALRSGEAGYSNMTGPVAIVSGGAGGADGASAARDASNRGYLGVEFSNEPGRSLVVASVSPAVSGDPGHLRPGDRVTAVGATTVRSFDELKPLLSAAKPGDAVELAVLRDDQPRTLKVRLLSVAEMISDRPATAPATP